MLVRFPPRPGAMSWRAADIRAWVTHRHRGHRWHDLRWARCWGRGCRAGEGHRGMDDEAGDTIERSHQAFNRRHLGAVGNLITDDCVFEATSPAPDGTGTLGGR